MDTELKETLKLLQTIANRAYWSVYTSGECGSDMSQDCEYCSHKEMCAANKRLNELLGE